MHFSVVIPAYNEASTIREIAIAALTYTPHVVVIDDGSSDNTAQLVQDLDIILIKHEQNKGKAAALASGIHASLELGVDAVITLDADGQHKTVDIGRFVETAQQFPDEIIIGSRLWDKHAFPRKRYLANKFANFWISWAAGRAVDDSQSGFRLYPTTLLQKLNISINRNKGFVLESEIIIHAAHLGYPCRSIQIDAIYHTDARPSHFRSVTDILFITRMVAGQLLLRGLYPAGLYRYLIHPHLKKTRIYQTGIIGLLVFLLSIIIMLATGLLTLLLLFSRNIILARSPCQSAQAGKLLVLGRRLRSGQPDHDYQQRLLRACHLLKSSADMEVLIVGGFTDGSVLSESAAGKQFLEQQGISTSRIQIEEGSTHTLENFRLIYKTLLNTTEPVTLITSRYHLGRSHDIANGFAIKHTLCGAEDYFIFNLPNLVHLFSEAFFLHWYWTAKFIGKLTRSQFILQRISNPTD
ncbi:MAG TPA: glycosyltransferase [Gammaproteobacteria bacterium]|nr:glycosyltransferase [Gammaproteobacteria bacterium]